MTTETSTLDTNPGLDTSGRRVCIPAGPSTTSCTGRGPGPDFDFHTRVPRYQAIS
ncbi:hypothetical protein ACFRAQ_08965 [Nocardia sp. NPDC056611]|uniref:hypothetical protein n=1 Tax=Nocardia sp. NPDC056611 TaxID=3345877 RepID=UPI00366B6180